MKISFFETRTGISFINLVLRDENEKSEIISQGQAGKNLADSHGNSRHSLRPTLLGYVESIL